MKLYGLILALALTSCVTIPDPDSPAQKVYAATQLYNVALSVAVAYKQLPPCEQPAAPVLCSDADTVETVQKADIAAFTALTQAQEIVRTSTATESALQSAVMWAQGAIRAFSEITNSLQTGRGI